MRWALALLVLLAPLGALAQVPSTVVHIPSITGATGPQGAAGATGATGAQGDPGPQGDPGADGLDTQPLLATYNPSAATSVIVSGFVDAAYRKYRLEWCFVVSTDDQELYLRTDSNGGASPDNGPYGYITRGHGSDAAAVTNANGSATVMNLVEDGAGNAIGNATGEHACGTVFVEHLGSASPALNPILRWDVNYISAAGRITRVYGAGQRIAQAAIDALEFSAEGSPTTTLTGQVRVYGQRDAN